MGAGVKVTKTELCLLGVTAVFLCSLLVLHHRDMTRMASQPVSVETERTVDPEELAPEPLLVDVNTADAEELAQLPGIGEELAGRIVAHREEYGPFEAIEEIMEVSGIGEGKFAALASYITVDGKETT